MDSKLILCHNIKLDKSYANVLSFELNDMLTLINDNKLYEQSNYNYIDYTKNEIMADVDYNTAINCNYIAFQNPRHGNKWYFAFIEDIIFKAPRQTFIKFTIDVWSTFFGDWSAKPCFVVREHVNSDNVGEHTVPESVTLGEYITTSHLRDSYNRGTKRIVISTNVTPSEGTPIRFGGLYNGLPSAFKYWAYALDDGAGVGGAVEVAQTHDGNINQMFILPAWLIEENGVSLGQITNTSEVKSKELGVSPITQLDSYIPTNKKLLTYPYCFIKASNDQGQEAILHQELWELGSNNEYKLDMLGCICAGGSIRLVPKNYKNDAEPYEVGINLGKFPQINWTTDPYINWLTQQGINQAQSSVSNVISSPDPVGTGVKEIGSLMYNEYRAERSAPQVFGNQNAGDVTFSTNQNCFHVERVTIRQEYAKQIDKYFSRYGYKVNDVKIPNITGRANFNFIEIGKDDCIGYGNVPPKYMEEINNIARQGVTIWHNHTNLGNYNIANGIV